MTPKATVCRECGAPRTPGRYVLCDLHRKEHETKRSRKYRSELTEEQRQAKRDSDRERYQEIKEGKSAWARAWWEKNKDRVNEKRQLQRDEHRGRFPVPKKIKNPDAATCLRSPCVNPRMSGSSLCKLHNAERVRESKTRNYGKPTGGKPIKTVILREVEHAKTLPRLNDKQQKAEDWPKPTAEQLARVKRVELPPLRGAGGLMALEIGVNVWE